MPHLPVDGLAVLSMYSGRRVQHATSHLLQSTASQCSACTRGDVCSMPHLISSSRCPRSTHHVLGAVCTACRKRVHLLDGWTTRGHRPTMPVTVSGPPADAAAHVTSGPAPRAASDWVTCSSRWAVMAQDVGCSKTMVGERATPVRECRRDASSVAPRESTTASISGV
jgi:hypothetical protein